MTRSNLRNAVILGVVLFVIAPIVMLLSVVNFFSADRTQAAERNWESTLGTLDEVLARFPATEANAAALEAERLSAALGITLSPRYLSRAQATPEAMAAFDRLRRTPRSRRAAGGGEDSGDVIDAIGPYNTAQLERVGRGEIDAPPAALTDYMRAHREELAALRRLLIEGDIPVWESDLSQMADAPIPNLLGQINLHKLLLAVALAQIHSGDAPGALDTIHASWGLARSLRDSPHLICQLIYLSATRMHVGALRHVRDVPADWGERLTEHDVRRSFLTAMQLEGWAWLHQDPGVSNAHTDFWASGNATNWLKNASARAVRPYVSLCMADVSDRWRVHVDRLAQMPALCDRPLPGEDGTKIPLARWNRIGALVVPNLGGSIARVARLELDRELLLLAIDADATRRATGAWPAAEADPASASCPDDRWVYTPAGDGLEIALSREIGWPGQAAPVVPSRILLDAHR